MPFTLSYDTYMSLYSAWSSFTLTSVSRCLWQNENTSNSPSMIMSVQCGEKLFDKDSLVHVFVALKTSSQLQSLHLMLSVRMEILNC